jgi:hypothetical protein
LDPRIRNPEAPNSSLVSRTTVLVEASTSPGCRSTFGNFCAPQISALRLHPRGPTPNSIDGKLHLAPTQRVGYSSSAAGRWQTTARDWGFESLRKYFHDHAPRSSRFSRVERARSRVGAISFLASVTSGRLPIALSKVSILLGRLGMVVTADSRFNGQRGFVQFRDAHY